MYRLFRRNRISISLLDKSGLTVTLGNEMFSLLFKSKVVSTRILIDCYINWNFMLHFLNLYVWIA